MIMEFVLGMAAGAVIVGTAWRIKYEKDNGYVVS